MNEEEKQAIEKLDYELTYSWVHNQGISKETLKLFKDIIDEQQKEIEKQQKQNEELKKEKRLLIEKYTDVVYECGKRNEKIEYLQKRLYRKGVFSKEKFVRFYPKQYQNEYVKNWVNESDGLTPKEMEELGYDVLEECLI